jgi:hypothetical protein
MPVSLFDGEVAAVVVSLGEMMVADGVEVVVAGPAESGAREVPPAASATTRTGLARPATRARHDGVALFPIRSSRAVSTGAPAKPCQNKDVQGRRMVDRQGAASPESFRVQ